MKINFVTYCDEKYEPHRSLLIDAGKNEFERNHHYKPTDIEKSFYVENKKILDLHRGAGYWLWKPYFILKTMEKMNDGDIVFYLDSGDYFKYGLSQYLKLLMDKNDIVLVPSSNKQRCYTKRDCFVMMDLDVEGYWNATQVEAGIVVVKKTERSKKIVEEWLEYSKNENIITDIPNVSGKENFSCFVDHRHDQSIISNLAKKYNLLLDNTIRRWVTCNVVVKNA